MTDGSEWDMQNMTTRGWTCHTRAQPECDIFNRGSSYFHVSRTNVCHMFCRMTNKISYKMAASLRVLPTKWLCGSFAHKMAAFLGGMPRRWRRFWEFTRKMAAWKICLQDGGNAAFLEFYPKGGGVGDLPTRRRRFWQFYPQDYYYYCAAFNAPYVGHKMTNRRRGRSRKSTGSS